MVKNIENAIRSKDNFFVRIKKISHIQETIFFKKIKVIFGKISSFNAELMLKNLVLMLNQGLKLIFRACCVSLQYCDIGKLLFIACAKAQRCFGKFLNVLFLNSNFRLIGNSTLVRNIIFLFFLFSPSISSFDYNHKISKKCLRIKKKLINSIVL
ncbi:hypothetical protein BpHYR1_013378 [Brachionus plicatilis]|uniref:Uncharacterized protein n=1 Tax=Brachionus plicatilis TaxID=10195 RepID=A0A3M7SLV6_BRAPC|nr:hypothetical protein BpHYR1_013378 [Brachionus plicatilis]